MDRGCPQRATYPELENRILQCQLLPARIPLLHEPSRLDRVEFVRHHSRFACDILDILAFKSLPCNLRLRNLVLRSRRLARHCRALNLGPPQRKHHLPNLWRNRRLPLRPSGNLRKQNLAPRFRPRERDLGRPLVLVQNNRLNQRLAREHLEHRLVHDLFARPKALVPLRLAPGPGPVPPAVQTAHLLEPFRRHRWDVLGVRDLVWQVGLCALAGEDEIRVDGGGLIVGECKFRSFSLCWSRRRRRSRGIPLAKMACRPGCCWSRAVLEGCGSAQPAEEVSRSGGRGRAC